MKRFLRRWTIPMDFCCLGELCRFVYVQVSVNSNTTYVPHTLHVDLRFVPLAGRYMASHARGWQRCKQATACSFQKRSLPFHSIAQIQKTLPILFGFKPKSNRHQNITGTKMKQSPARNRRQFRSIQYFHHKLLYTLKNESEPNGLITDRIPPHIKISIFFLNDARKK